MDAMFPCMPPFPPFRRQEISDSFALCFPFVQDIIMLTLILLNGPTERDRSWTGWVVNKMG